MSKPLVSLSLPTLILMENAGRGAAAWLVELAAEDACQTAARPFSFRSPATGPGAAALLAKVLDPVRARVIMEATEAWWHGI